MTQKQSSKLACVLIDQRMERVSDLLPLAATLWRNDCEYVHQLRIATRQALAGLDAYRSHVEEKDWAWLRKRLKLIRSAAGDARDLDVMLVRFLAVKASGGKALRRLLYKERRIAHRPLIKLAAGKHRRLEFEASKKRCLNAIQQASDHQVLVSPIKRIEDLVHSIAQTQPHGARDFATFHQLRVQTKQLRYTLELLAELSNAELGNSELGNTACSMSLHPMICDVQKQLGQLNDHVVAARRLSQWAQKVRSKKCVALLKRLSEKENTKGRKEGKSFFRWWHSEHSAQFKKALTEYSPPVQPMLEGTL